MWEWSEWERKCLETVVGLDFMLVLSTGRLCSSNLSLRRRLVSAIHWKLRQLHCSSPKKAAHIRTTSLSRFKLITALLGRRIAWQEKNVCKGDWGYSVWRILNLILYLELACSRLSDSGEDMKLKGTRKVDWAGKRKKEGIESSAAPPLPSFLPFYLRVRAFSIQRTRLSRNREQANLEHKSIVLTQYSRFTALFSLSLSGKEHTFKMQESSYTCFSIIEDILYIEPISYSWCFKLAAILICPVPSRTRNQTPGRSKIWKLPAFAQVWTLWPSKYLFDKDVAAWMHGKSTGDTILELLK